ncbi:MAG: helix-turn-helix domain-containing protein, partial [Firmicutes bacterium]|nr:helix-turn-helix domain-containing protein [Bacillota bacterium]
MTDSLGRRIREARLRHGMTQTQLAQDIVTPSMISQIESGKAQPSIGLVQRLAERLGLHLEDLMAPIEVDEALQTGVEVLRALLAAGETDQVQDLLRERVPEDAVDSEVYRIRAELAFSQGRLADAAGALQRALHAARAQHHEERVAHLYRRLGDVTAAAGDHATALHIFEQARLCLGANNQISTLEQWEILMSMARSHQGLGQTAQALALAQEAANHAVEGEDARAFARHHAQRAVDALASADYVQARRLAGEAIAMSDVFHFLERSIASQLTAAEQLLAAGRPEAALAVLDNCQSHGGPWLRPPARVQLLCLLAQVRFLLDDLAAGIGALEEALATVAGMPCPQSTEGLVSALIAASERCMEAGNPTQA